MPKPWAKYEIGFINHRKFGRLTANAICLWIEAKDYADEHHTDGLLPVDDVKHMRFYSKKSVGMLMQSAGQKSANSPDAYEPLWSTHAVGWKMHDYLEHNECRETVLARIALGEAVKATDRARKATARAAKSAQAAKQQRDLSAGRPSGQMADTARTVRGQSETSASNQKPDPDPEESTERSLSEQRARLSDAHKALGSEKRLVPLAPLPSDALADRAGNLVERYGELFSQHRFGARYHARPALDYDEALKLVAEWDDDARLEKLAVLVLTTDDPWIAGTDRSFKIFALKASWADQRLAEWEAKRRLA